MTRKYCEDTTRLMIVRSDDSDGNFDIDLEEQIDAHNENLYMRGATDALRGLVEKVQRTNYSISLAEMCCEILVHPGDFAEECLDLTAELRKIGGYDE